MPESQPPKCRSLVLDAGPLLSLSPLRGLAEKYVTTPQVLAELRDPRAREHFEKLGLMSGVKIEVRSPTPSSITQVIQWSKKTGDYSVLSHPDICVLALTLTLHEEAEKLRNQAEKGSTGDGEGSSMPEIQPCEPGSAEVAPDQDKCSMEEVANGLAAVSLKGSQCPMEALPQDEINSQPTETEEADFEPLDVQIAPIADGEGDPSPSNSSSLQPSSDDHLETDIPLYDDPSDEDDGEGEWITPNNVALHKSKALDLLPDDASVSKKKSGYEVIEAGCMTADFAMQNVLLQMGLNLVGLEGRRIERVKTWVLRCHACFKICKDSSKKFCPSCGNPTLLRASVTLSSPNASKDAPVMQVHLKPNFQYKLRGTKYSIPAPKPGSAKGGAGTGLILREDQTEYMRAKKLADGKREREEHRMTKGILSKGFDGGVNAGTSSWMDPDWMPEIVSAGASGKGRTTRNSRMDGDLPQIGYGRKNPNEKRRKK